MEGSLLQRREKFYTDPYFHRLKCVAERETKAKCGKLNSTFFQVNAAQPREKFTESFLVRPFPIVARTPMKHKSFVGFYKKDSGSTSRIQNDFIVLF